MMDERISQIENEYLTKFVEDSIKKEFNCFYKKYYVSGV